MPSTRFTLLSHAVLLSLVLTTAEALVAQGAGAASHAAQTLPEARAAFDDALDTWLRFRTPDALAMYAAASELDPAFGLARALGAGLVPFAERAAELDRAVADAVDGPAEELLIAAAEREVRRGNPRAARAMRRAAAEVATDRRLRLHAAWLLPPEERQPIVRDLMREHPDFAPAAAALALALVPSVFATVDAAVIAEAEAAARTALRLEPEHPYTHLALAQVLTRKGDRAEARTHLGHATLSPTYLRVAHHQLAQMDLQDGRIPEARATLERALALDDSDAGRRALREAMALTHLHEGDLAETLRAYEALAEEADSRGFGPAAGDMYATAAIIAAGAEDAAAFDRYRAAAEQRLPASANAQWLIIGPALLGRAADAAAALERELEQTADDRSVAAEETRERMRGYVELARDRPAAALAHFERAGRNPYSQLGLWEAHRRLGNDAAARAAREDMLTRKDFTIFSTATPIARYRARGAM